MPQDEKLTLEERVLRLETRLDSIISRMDADRPSGRSSDSSRRAAQGQPSRLGRAMPSYRNAFAAKSLEWWLARGGAVLTCLALVLLYQYAIERNWITPVVRVGAGMLVGAVLVYFAARIHRSEAGASDDAVGLREVLLGGGLGAWYITAYAAAIFYGLIPVASARLIFLGLSIAGAWIALREHRSVLGFLTLGIGFLTPSLLPSPQPSIPALALYLGALAAVGLILYIIRGWQSILWLTAIAFWWSASTTIELLSAEPGGFGRIAGSLVSARIAVTLLIVAAGAAMVRTPLLRRRLLATGSALYTEPNRSALSSSIHEALARRIETFSGTGARLDSPALWIITIGSPLLSVLFLSWIWTSVESAAWGIVALALAAVAYRLAASSDDEEFAHVEAAATVVWSLAGILWLADFTGTRTGQSSAFTLGAAAAHSFGALKYLRGSVFAAAQKISGFTAGFALLVVLLSETLFRNLALHGFDIWWTVAELMVVAACAYVWWTRRRPLEPLALPTVFGTGSYIALMFIDARILGEVWPPLVTASFAIAGAVVLMIGRSQKDARTLRQLGGFTLIVVVLRLFMIDLARVETIWRVLLFLGVGALFLFTSHRLQPRSSTSSTDPVS